MVRLFVALTAVVLATAACGSSADIGQAAKLVDVSSGWYDAGVNEQGMNKLVPSLTFRIKNDGPEAFGSVQLNVIFKLIHDKEEWSTAFVRGVGPEGLAPAATTPPIVVRAQQGYTGTQPRLQMLSNSQFVDFKAEVFGKHGSATWVKLGEFPITRQLLTR